MALSTHSRLSAQAFTFSSLERLFPSHCAVPAPFTQEEGQELMTLIRSFDGTYETFFFLLQQIYLYMRRTDDHDDHGIQTRIVSRVFLEVGQSTFTFFK